MEQSVPWLGPKLKALFRVNRPLLDTFEMRDFVDLIVGRMSRYRLYRAAVTTAATNIASFGDAEVNWLIGIERQICEYFGDAHARDQTRA